jgi:hypothetical protein
MVKVREWVMETGRKGPRGSDTNVGKGRRRGCENRGDSSDEADMILARAFFLVRHYDAKAVNGLQQTESQQGPLLRHGPP